MYIFFKLSLIVYNPNILKYAKKIKNKNRSLCPQRNIHKKLGNKTNIYFKLPTSKLSYFFFFSWNVEAGKESESIKRKRGVTVHLKDS